MKHRLILGCGIGRCGTNFLSYFMFLNHNIAVWNGPGMGELAGYVAGKSRLPLSDLHGIWGDDYQEPTHGLSEGLSEWDHSKDFKAYYEKRITERRKSSAYFISHNVGETWYTAYRDSFNCDIYVVYSAREIVGHYRAFKQWYGVDMVPEYFMDRIRGSLALMDVILADDVPVVCLNTTDYSVKNYKQKMKVVMDKIAIPMSKEQSLFIGRRRMLGEPATKPMITDAELLKELKKVPDFDLLKRKYDTLRTKYEA